MLQLEINTIYYIIYMLRLPFVNYCINTDFLFDNFHCKCLQNWQIYLINTSHMLFLGTLPDALAGGCSKCNEKQKAAAEKVIRYIIKNRSSDWKRLAAKYDPSGVYRSKYEAQYNIKA